VLSVYYDKICLKFASHHFLLYVVYICQKSLNFIYAFKCYRQKRKLPHFSWTTLYICILLVLIAMYRNATASIICLLNAAVDKLWHFVVVSVPVIAENQCRTYTYSIQLHSPSPLTSPLPATGVEHYLLYREASVNKIWKSISLYDRVDHRVFGLEPDTLYDFVVMACDSNCECQVSNMVTMKTERSAYWTHGLPVIRVFYLCIG